MIRLKQVFIVFVAIFSIVFASQSATFTVSNTNDNGAGSLRQALSDVANTTGGPHTIVFSIAAGSTINISSSLAIYNDADFNGLTINGFIDNVAGPDVIIRGNSGTVCNGIKGFDISAPITTLKIYGLVFQNLEYGIHYQANNKGTVLNSEIKGCYFGTNLAGSAIQDGICKSGIELDRASSVIVGGLATITAGGVANLERNVFGGTCNENNVGEINKYAAVSIEDCNNTIVRGNYIGVNAAGTSRLVIGNLTLKQPPNRHGIFQTSNSASTIIDKNVISGAVGSGIYVNGGNNGIVTGNIIGLDATGTLGYNVTTPALSFGNEAAGIYLKQVNGWLIGYNGGVAADERNVISANGGAIHTWGTCDFGWDFTNQQGIYTEGVNNTTIRGNYIGTNTAGTNAGQTATNLIYNRAGGVKITGEGNGASTNNVIGGTGTNDKNVISNHGLFWGDKNTLNTRCGNVTFNTYDGGNGLVIQHDNTTFNRVEGNYIGLAADGITALGNTTSGIEIQGARSTTIGGATAAQRNYISGNTYGIRFMEDFSNTHDRAQSNNVYGNWIGLNINGTAVGNGQSVSATDGAGILLEMGSNTNNIGGLNSGEGNVISGNRTGIIIRNDELNATGPAFSNTIVGNIIGMSPTLTAAIPNTSTAGGYGHGIQITMGSRGTVFPYGNTIGGASVSARNIIAGNQKSGINITHTAAIVSSNAGNQIIGNFIGTANGTTTAPNGQNGIEILNVSGSNATNGTIIRGNLISGNTQNGISLNNADFNTIQTNVIGGTANTTPTALANGLNGITLTNGSSSNIIGGIVTTPIAESNFIGFNTSNGVNISGATSNLNSIHKNIFECNALRGIELNGTGNDNYSRPTITGNPTSMIITGPAGSFIELYVVDGCATCPANPTRLQGKTLVATGNSPLTFTPTAGITYTAIAHQANATAAHNSSEFSQCYTLCATPTPAITGNTNLCENVTGITFTTPNNAGNTYAWTVPTGVTITAGQNTNSITVSIGNFPVTGSIQVTETVSVGCSNTALAALSVKDNPTTSNAGVNQNICGTSVTLAGNSPTVGTGTWTVSPSTGVTITNPALNNSTATGLSQGTDYTFTWTIVNSPCANSASSVVVSNKSNPTAANAGTNTPICGTTVTLAGNTPTVGTGTWTVAPSTGVTIASPNTANSSVSGLSQGVDYTFTWTIANAPCTASTSSVVISNKSNPTVSNAGIAQSICGTSVTLAGNTPTVGTGTWTVSPSTGVTITSPNVNNTTATGLSQGTNYTFTWTIANAPCTASSSTVAVTNSQNPTVSNAGIAQSICGTTATLAGNTPTTGTGTWTVSPATGVTITTPSTPNAAVSGLTQGTDYTFTWTISNGTCTASTSSVVVSNKSNPTVSVAGSNQDICGTTVTLAGNSATTGTGTWTVSPSTGVTITSPNVNNSTASGLTAGTDYTFTWTIANAPCTASSSTVTVRTDVQATTVDAGPDLIGCQITSGSLSAVNPTTGTAMWLPVTGLTFSNANSPTTSVSGIVVGQQYTVTWEAKGPLGICPATSDNIIIRSDQNPTTVSAGNDTTLCNTGTVELTAAGAPGTWTVASGTATIASPTSNTSSITIDGSTATLTWTVSAGTCSAGDDIVVSRTDLATPAITGDLSQCASSTNVNLTATPDVTGTGGSYTWEVVSGDVTITSSTTVNPVEISTGLTGGEIRVKVTSGGCIDLPATATITINPDNSEAVVGPDFATCLNEVTLTGNVPTNGTGTWTVVNQPSIVFTPGANNAQVTAGTLVLGTTYEFVYTISGACGLDKDDTVAVTAGLNGFVLVDVTGPTDTLCATTARSLTAVVTGGSGNFTFHWVGSNGFTSTTTNPTISVVPNSNLVTYQVYVEDNINQGCQTGVDATIINAVEKQNLEIMNLVTPNNDGKNDLFIVRDKDTFQNLIPEGSFLEVYNRWGDRVFKAQDYRNNWQCSELSDGMYYYYLKTGCGEQEYKGWVHILGNTNN
ncbi:MAG: gliding motility-associated C-terminal domain-containing protein [Cytophagaceae bacterium]